MVPVKHLFQIFRYKPSESIGRSSRQVVFCKKGILKNFAKFTGKHLCQSLYFNKVAGLSFKGSFNFNYRDTLHKTAAYNGFFEKIELSSFIGSLFYHLSEVKFKVVFCPTVI